ncbi:MAG: helix-turn-helix domain-containing protein [Kiritimatiellae bacterium]|nr:helix-turn-helix domain-containing protein [Kiritimatiellia bacterium]
MKSGKKVGWSKAGRKGEETKGKRPPGGRGGRGAAGQNDAGAIESISSGGHKHSQKYELKRRAVQLCLEESVPVKVVAREVGVSRWTIFEWGRQYRKNGEEGLQPRRGGDKQPVASGKPDSRALIRAEIMALKRKHPAFGIKRISQTLRRIFHLPTSPETVRKTLHRAKLIKPRKKKTPSNPSKPRFFERATPNQMWQSDIFPFKLGGEAVRPPEWLGPGGYAYLIGFIDDHSRYITALELFRSQTADNLLEVFRRGVGAHGVPNCGAPLKTRNPSAKSLMLSQNHAFKTPAVSAPWK